MPGNYSRYNTVASGDTITAANYNGEFDTIRTNFTPAGLDDASATLTDFRTVFDPGESGSENLPSSLAEEVQALRNMVKEITGKTYWYQTPTASLSNVCPVGTIIPFYDFNAAVSFDANVFAYCNGATINSASSPINGLATPDLSNRYLVGFGTEANADIGSATWNATVVGSAAHQVDLSHTHTFDHNHAINSHNHTSGTLQFQTLSVASSTLKGFDVNGTATTLASVSSVGSGATAVLSLNTTSATYYTASGSGSTGSSTDTTANTSVASNSSLSATQSIQPRSIRVRYIIRYI